MHPVGMCVGGFYSCPDPKDAASLLPEIKACLADMADLKARTAGKVPELKVDRAAVAKLLADAPDGFLPAEKASEVLRLYGLPVARETWCPTADKVPAAAARLGYPVVLKAHAAERIHKTESGAVAVNLADEKALRTALDGMTKSIGKVDAFQVQEFVAGGTEIAVGAVRAEGLGATVMFGLGGIFIEALRDVRFGLAPLTDVAAERMIRKLKFAKLLGPFRGKPGVDQATLRDVLLRVGRLAADHPSIVEMDLNPVLAFADGARTRVADVRIRVGKA